MTNENLIEEISTLLKSFKKNKCDDTKEEAVFLLNYLDAIGVSIILPVKFTNEELDEVVKETNND